MAFLAPELDNPRIALTTGERRRRRLAEQFPTLGGIIGQSSAARRLASLLGQRNVRFGTETGPLNFDRILSGGYNVGPELQNLYPGGRQNYLDALKARALRLMNNGGQ